MFKKFGIGVLIVIVGFAGYVLTRPTHFTYERSGIIAAPPEKIFPYLSNFKNGEKWTPYEKIDPNLKTKFTGVDGQVGSVEEFEGNSDVGAGKLEMLNLVPNESVEIKLTMLKPIYGESVILYRLTREENGTKFSWSMSGDGGFMTQLMSVLVDCEKMIGDDMEKGISSLKTVVENESK